MAGLSTKAIKTRIKSMQSTRQITKAMELVAASKLRSAQAKAISSRPYFQTLYAAMDEIADTNNDFTSPYLHANPNGKPAYVVIAGDRGLAGGYIQQHPQAGLFQDGGGRRRASHRQKGRGVF